MTEVTSQAISERPTDQSKRYVRPVLVKGPSLSAVTAGKAVSGPITADGGSG